MKKVLALLLAFVMVFSVLAACGPTEEDPVTTDPPAGTDAPSEDPSEEPSDDPDDPTDDPTEPEPTEPEEEVYLTMNQEEALAIRAAENVEPSGTLVVGDGSASRGDFWSGWTNAAPDAQVKDMVHGEYGLIYFDELGVMHVNPVVVEEVSSEVDESGNKTFTFKIYENLVWNTGDPITGDDYVFSVLMGSCWEAGTPPIGMSNTSGAELLGYAEFHALPEEYVPSDDDDDDDEVEEFDYEYVKREFAGVRRIDDYSFSITVNGEWLPYWYELALVAYGPIPLHRIAPGVEILDDGNGAYLTEEFTVALLEETVMDAETGYRYQPDVTCGPYQFIGHDIDTDLRTIEVNPNFLGTFDGKKPAIETIVLKRTVQDTEMEELATGEVDLLAPINGEESIRGGLKVVEANDHLTYRTYLRNGYGYLGFQCDESPTQYREVRHAIAHLLDRAAFLEQYAGPFGQTVHSMYGLGQVEYQMREVELDEALNPYTFNPERAVELLEEAGFVLDAAGNEYAGEGTRHKEITNEDELPPASSVLAGQLVEVDGKTLMPLQINWMNTPDNPVSELIRALLLPEAEKVGLEITDNTQEFNVLLKHFYREALPEEELEYTMFNLATGFSEVLSFWYSVNPDPDYLGYYNTSFILDDSLYNLAMEMYHTEPGDFEAWYDNWLEFQIAYNDYLPELPLYSDEYHVFHNTRLVDYRQDVLWDYGRALTWARIEE